MRSGTATVGCALVCVLIACPGSDEGGIDGGSAGGDAASGGASAGASGAGASGGSSGASGAAGGSAGAGGRGGESASGGMGGAGGDVQLDAGDDASDASDLPVSTQCEPIAAQAPASSWINVTGSLAGMASECGNLTLVAADPCSDRVIAGVAGAGLYATGDRGGSWAQLGTGAGSDPIVHRPSAIVFDPAHPEIFYETGIYGVLDDGIYKTEDGGETLKKLGSIGHLDLVSVDFGDPERKTLLAGVHETKRKLWLSRDSGASWTDIGAALPEDSHFSAAPIVLDAQRFLLGACGWGDGACGVYASDDGGESWQSKSTEAPSGTPLWMKDGQLVWPTIYGSGAILSDDAGQSWRKVDGPRSTPVELPDGRIVAVGGDHLIVSADAGASWSNIGEPLPYQAAGVAYSRSQRAFYIWRNDCGDLVLDDAIMSAGLPE